MTPNNQNPKKGKVIQVWKHRVSNNIKPKLPTPRYITVKMTKVTDKRILKAARKNQHVTDKENHIRLLADFPAETI